jgi:hypothetical protein
MADSDTDDGFQQVFARRGRGGTSSAVSGTSSAPAGEGSAPPLRFRPEERRIASAQRAHARAVQSVIDLASASRNQTLASIAALEDAETRGAKAPAPVAAPRAGAGAASLQQTYSAALAAASAGASSEDQMRAWQLVFGVAELELQDGGGVGSREGTLRVQLTALSQQAVLHNRAERYRGAIDALERTLELSKQLPPSEATCRAAADVAGELVRLHSKLGGLDPCRNFLVLKDKLLKEAASYASAGGGGGSDGGGGGSGGGGGGSASSSPPSVPAGGGGGGGNSSPPPSAAPAGAPSASLPPAAAAPPLTSLPLPPPPSPPPAVAWDIPEMPPDDGTPQALFTRAALAAMVRAISVPPPLLFLLPLFL